MLKNNKIITHAEKSLEQFHRQSLTKITDNPLLSRRRDAQCQRFIEQRAAQTTRPERKNSRTATPHPSDLKRLKL